MDGMGAELAVTLPASPQPLSKATQPYLEALASVPAKYPLSSPIGRPAYYRGERGRFPTEPPAAAWLPADRQFMTGLPIIL